MIRQGDILLIPVDKEPENVKERVSDGYGSITIGHGEVTGHTHTLEKATWLQLATQEISDLAQFAETGEGTVFVDVEEDTTLTHQEHDPLTVPAGLYQVVRHDASYRGEIIGWRESE